MNMYDEEQNFVTVDAQSSVINNKLLSKEVESWNSVLDHLTVDQYKSMLFLLMDEIGEEEFLKVTKQEESYIRQKLEEILKMKNNYFLIELLGTLKLYEKLKKIDTCHHIYEKFCHKEFNNIKVWKMFYFLCEELTDIDLAILRQFFPDDQINTIEEWFCLALQKNLISKTDFSMLEKIFHNYPNCLEIIKNFVKPESYDIRTPDANTHCGIAVILNFDEFDTKYEQREGSDLDVKALKDVWNMFGFKTEVYNNLTFDGTFAVLKYYASLDHSSYDAFACCILSHGHSNSVISSDDKEMLISHLIGEITDKCATLDSKPKLFFIQACQGVCIQQGFGKPVYSVENPDVPQSLISSYIPPITSDVLLAISSINGYVSFRNIDNGSWFMQTFCSVMKQKGDKVSILDVMIEVNHIVRKFYKDFGPDQPRNAKQISNCFNTFGKVLMLKKRIQ